MMGDDIEGKMPRMSTPLMMTTRAPKVPIISTSEGSKQEVDIENVMMNIVGMQIIIKELTECLKTKTKEEKKEKKKANAELDVLK